MHYEKHPYIPLCMACIQGTMLMYNGEDQRSWSWKKNHSWPTQCDVYVHQAQGKYWDFQRMKENESPTKFWTT